MLEHEEHLETIIEHVANKCHMKGWNYVRRNFEENAENYFGLLVAVTLTGKIDSVETTKHLIVKFVPNDHELKETGALRVIFTTEIYVYTNLLVFYESLKTNMKINELVPECFFTDATEGQETLVMKDMRSDGFQRCDKGRFLDLDHITVALKSLAQFHALSIILQEKKGDVVDKRFFQPFTDTYPSHYLGFLKKVLENNSNLFREDYYEEFVNNMVLKVESSMLKAINNSKRLVYGHGDFWRENIMFKYVNNKPSQACLLDFQATRKMSPAQDFLYFILTSTDAEVRRGHFQNCIFTYYDTLQRILLENGLQPRCLYSEEDFKSDLKTVAPISFVMAFMSFSIWFQIDDSVQIRPKNVCNTERDSVLFKIIVTDIVRDLIEFGYLSL